MIPTARIGWREWISLPALGLGAVKAKVDTGARTSSLHAFDLERFTEHGKSMVRFSVHPLQRRDDVVVHCRAEVIDERSVSDSGGHNERRLVIFTPIRLGEHEWETEVTLTDRAEMRFRMLLGRAALRGRFLVDPGASYRGGPRLDRLLGLVP